MTDKQKNLGAYFKIYGNNLFPGQVEATYFNGILKIRAPKSDMATRRKVK